MNAGSVALAAGLMVVGGGLFAAGRVRAHRSQDEQLGNTMSLDHRVC